MSDYAAEPSTTASGWAYTALFLMVLGVGASCLYFGILSQPSHDPILRLAVWSGFVICTVFAIYIFFLTMRIYDVRLWRLPSTYLMLLVIILLLAVSTTFIDNPGRIQQFQLNAQTPNWVMLWIASVLVLVILSLIINIVKTNLVFAVLLTLTQLFVIFLILAVVATVFDSSKRRHGGYS